MNWFALNYALRLVAVFVGTLVLLMVPVGLVAMLMITTIIILAVVPDPMWLVRKLKAISMRKTCDDPDQDI